MDFLQNKSKITIITGHYGAGKTNLAVNLALALKKSGKSTTIADLDIVNPYFRTADFKEMFDHSGIKLAVSGFANTSLDIPALNLDIKAEVSQCDRLIIDVGGDAEGAKALGRFAPVISELGYEMIYVINQYRYLTQSAKQAVDIMRSIEKGLHSEFGGLKCTAIFNNSHLCNETTKEVADRSVPFAMEVAKLTGLPLIEFPVTVYVKPVWDV